MSDTPYSARIRTVELLERNKSQVTSIKIYRDNAQVVPTSAKYTLFDPNGDKIVNDGSANEARRRYLKVKGINTSIIKS